jgi:hypothetical protein
MNSIKKKVYKIKNYLVKLIVRKLYHIRYSVDSIEIADNTINIYGWVFHETKRLDQIELIIECDDARQDYSIKDEIFKRQDVYHEFQNEYSLNSGFASYITVLNSTRCKISLFLATGNKVFKLDY